MVMAPLLVAAVLLPRIGACNLTPVREAKR